MTTPPIKMNFRVEILTLLYYITIHTPLLNIKLFRTDLIYAIISLLYIYTSSYGGYTFKL